MCVCVREREGEGGRKREKRNETENIFPGETGEDRCAANGTICGGGEVFFNTSHSNHLHSLPVQHEWLCSKVYFFFGQLLCIV